MKRTRLTIGASMVVVATVAALLAAFRPISEGRAVEIVTRDFLRANPGSTKAELKVQSNGWDERKKVWVIGTSYRACFGSYSVGRWGRCEREGTICV